MRYRKGIDASEATEEELLRYQMERIVKESCDENLGECSIALAELHRSLKDTHSGRFVFLLVSFQFFVNFYIFVVELLWGKR